ncbi:MAG TPA: hypothetical protein VGY56_02300 [Verrucomicrobiae bacterium]|nr:hypothetical protein [Verrucomicrobiae bacterium]
MRRRGKILIALAGAICAVILTAIVRHYQLRAATDSYVAQLKAEGEPMDCCRTASGLCERTF